jgi:hypothetical protein
LALQHNSGLGSLHESFRFTSITRSRTVGRTPWTGDQLVARLVPVHTQKNARTTQTLSIRARVGLEPTVRASEDSLCLRLGPHERTKCVRFNALCDVRFRNRKKPIDPNLRVRACLAIGFFLFLQRTSQSALQRTHFVRSYGPSLRPLGYRDRPERTGSPKKLNTYRAVELYARNAFLKISHNSRQVF